MKPIRFALLKEFSDAKMVHELIAERTANENAFHLIARTRAGDRTLVTNRCSAPRRFKTLDAIAVEVAKLNFTHFSVTGLGTGLRAYR